MVFLSVGIIVPIVIVLLLLLIAVTGYVKAPPNTAFIISGPRNKVLIGKSGIKIPFFERLDKLSLEVIQVDVKTSDAVPTADYINIRVDSVVNVQISDEPDKLNLAAKNFLNRTPDYIGAVAREVLEGNMREIVGKMKLEEMVSDRQKFADQVRENASPDLAAMGLKIVNFNVQNFKDSNGVIEDLGIDNISQIKKKAAIAKAEADKEIAIARAEADKQANDARVESDRQIAIKNNELAIQKSELQKASDTKKAEADAAYQIQEQAQRQSIEVAASEADIARTEKSILLKEKEVQVTKQALDAEIRQKAEAEKYARIQRAEAELYERQKDAEAKKYEKEQEAEAARAQADAARYAKEQEAEGIRKAGEAEAAAIEAKGLAEAAAMRQKAEAYKQYNNAAMAEMLIKVLPDIAGKIAEPIAAIDKVTLIGGGSGDNGVTTMSDNVPIVMSKLFETMKETTGVDLKEVMRASTYDAKVNRNIHVTGLDREEAETAAAAGVQSEGAVDVAVDAAGETAEETR